MTHVLIAYVAVFTGFVATMAAVYARTSDRNGWRRL
jgi:hypothetical protein